MFPIRVYIPWGKEYALFTPGFQVSYFIRLLVNIKGINQEINEVGDVSRSVSDSDIPDCGHPHVCVFCVSFRKPAQPLGKYEDS